MALTLISLLLAPAVRGEDAVRVVGTDGTAHTWTVSRIKEVLSSEIKSIEFTSHGQKHACKAVSLLEILNASGIPATLKMAPKADPHVKNYNLRLAVLVQAKDGYAATFSMGELLPDIGGCQAWVALEEDAKPLPERDGMAKLIVPTDQKPVRWVRDIASVTVIDPSAATTQPASPSGAPPK